MRASALAAAALVALVCVAAQAQWRQWDSDFDEDVKPWQEIEARIPAYPKPENLVPFAAGPMSPHRFYIDAPSLSIGEDGVVRYTLVIKAAGGATNVTFEGMRCELRQQKYYATGRADGSWMRARKPQWRRIERQDIDPHHGALYADFLCSGVLPVATVREVLQRLRYVTPAVRD
jgi:hypothetical protein